MTNAVNVASLGSTGVSTAFKNRIINGAMVINQRGGTTTINSSAYTYSVDRFFGFGEPTDGVFTLEQSTTAPTGFNNSLKVTVTTADASIGSTQRYFIGQKIEGYNIADMGFGTASAKTFTISAQVQSSVTGTFGGVLMNDAFDRAYPFTYTISSANTWTPISIVIAGDTTGTWLTTNGSGLNVFFSIGAGSGRLGTAGAWQTPAAPLFGATGQVNLIATNGATFYITGVQLEVGSAASGFDYRPYGTELNLCYRYYYKWVNNTGGGKYGITLQAWSSTGAFGKLIDLPVTMRTTPTCTTSGTFNGLNSSGSVTTAYTSTTIDAATAQTLATGNWSGTSGLSAGNATVVQVTSNAYIEASAEL